VIREFSLNEVWLLVLAARWTVVLSAMAFVGGGVGGFVVAVARVSPYRPLATLAAAFIKVVQGTPLLMQLYLVYFGASLLRLTSDAWTAAALGLTLYASAFLGEIWRGAIEAIPQGQSEAANALGLHYVSRMKDIVLPQALRISLPATVGFLVQLIKGTSIASIIGFIELTRAGQLIVNVTFQPMIVYPVVAVLYFILCYPISLAALRLERRIDADLGIAQHR